ncbi:hypothetical protein EDD18DRAFT_1064533 [Armillaria luteobubalina]|uniref:Uncharacterized protein n=1 Tax=Armillaria luteobubalina TaxID=153913 RepID=A0AA39UUA5_9AGAR|nr:hypothetical protein EDD18DRAFT_1064533 [Armillaria luteobubalina]
MYRTAPSRFRLHGMRCLSTSSSEEYKVLLDRAAQTVYVSKDIATALGWHAQHAPEVSLKLNGREDYIAITKAGSDSDALGRVTIESLNDDKVQGVIHGLKQSDE